MADFGVLGSVAGKQMGVVGTFQLGGVYDFAVVAGECSI